MFKTLIGRGHVEFSTNHQQDAQEYFLHFMDLVEQKEKNDFIKLKDLFKFQVNATTTIKRLLVSLTN